MKKLIAFLSIALAFSAQAQLHVPEKIIGNWVNEKTNNWDYGFYEHFAIYNTDFWDYASIQENKKSIDVVLEKGDEKLSLKLSKVENGYLTLTGDGRKPERYRINQPGFFPYPQPDHTPFKNSGFTPDTVTIIGYYRNIDKLKKQEKKGLLPKGPFKVSVNDLVVGEEIEYFADFDSLGRFKLKFQVLNTQEIFVDWGRVTKQMVVEPGEKIFLFVDIADFFYYKTDKDRQSYKTRPKQIVCMGTNARIHNEIMHYSSSFNYLDREELNSNASTDMAFIKAAEEIYHTRLAHLQNYVKDHPHVSDRFKDFESTHEKYEYASTLLQHRFDLRKQKKAAFDSGYLEYIKANFPLDHEQSFTLVRDYSFFIRDYIGYHQDLQARNGSYNVNFSTDTEEVVGQLKINNLLSVEDMEVISRFKELENKDKKDNKEQREGNVVVQDQIVNDYQALINSSKVKEALTQSLWRKYLKGNIDLVDSLIENKNLRELLIARALYEAMDHHRQPLSADNLAMLKEKITNPAVRDFIESVNNHYLAVASSSVSYVSSLKNTDHLNETKDADQLFEQLIAPYKGKVIYLDFWGTWCSPCKRQMPFAAELKKALAGKDVIFMYLANRSPEKSWLNVIKEMHLTGDNIVHYRLPNEQQSMLERKFGVNSFPTYMIFDKEGKMVDNKAPKPEHAKELLKKINSLLASK